MKTIRIAFLGLGTVGTGTYRLLNKNRDVILKNEHVRFEVCKILVKDLSKKRAADVKTQLLTDRIDDIVNDSSISTVIECMGGENPALSYITRCLQKSKHVVTANKELIAKHGKSLMQTAAEQNCNVLFEASAVGGVPIVRVLRDSLQANRVTKLMGIINGTTNYILTQMIERQLSFDEALQQAQSLGYAEPDPTADIEAFDAVYKCSILASLAFSSHVDVDSIYREGITGIESEDMRYAGELGYTIKLVAIAKKTEFGIEAHVHPTLIPKQHPLAAVRDSYNAVFVTGDSVGDLMFYGKGAGAEPTASAMVSDLLHSVKAQQGPSFLDVMEAKQESVNQNWETEFYIRMTVMDKPGVLSAISGCFGKNNVSLSTVIQKGRSCLNVPLIFITHKAKEDSIKKALDDIKDIPSVINVNSRIRVEN